MVEKTCTSINFHPLGVHAINMRSNVMAVRLYILFDSQNLMKNLCSQGIHHYTIIHACERFEPRSHFKSLIVRVNVVLNRTVVVVVVTLVKPAETYARD